MGHRWLWSVWVLTACAPPEPMNMGSDAVTCFRASDSKSPVVARVGAEALTWDHIVARVEEQGSLGRNVYANSERLRQLVEDQVRLWLLTQAALERGLDKDPDVVEAARRVMVRKLLDRDMGAEAFDDEDGDKRLLAYYERRRDEYQQPEARRIMHIQLAPTPEGRAQASQILSFVRSHADNRYKFRSQALQFTQDRASKERGGELPFLSYGELQGRFGRSFADQVFKMEPSAFAEDPIQSTKGWHVVMLLARREARLLEFDEVREDIRDRLLSRRRSTAFEAYLDSIRQRHPVAIYEQRLDDLHAHIKARFGL